MTARHAAPDRDRVGTALAAGWATLNLVGFGILGLIIDQQQIATPTTAGHAASAPEREPAAA